MKTIAILLTMTTIICIGGCADPNKPSPPAKIKYITPKIAPECDADGDSTWQAPNGDESRSAGAWRDNANHTGFDKMRSDRSVCWAGLKTFKKG